MPATPWHLPLRVGRWANRLPWRQSRNEETRALASLDEAAQYALTPAITIARWPTSRQGRRPQEMRHDATAMARTGLRYQLAVPHRQLDGQRIRPEPVDLSRWSPSAASQAGIASQNHGARVRPDVDAVDHTCWRMRSTGLNPAGSISRVTSRVLAIHSRIRTAEQKPRRFYGCRSPSSWSSWRSPPPARSAPSWLGWAPPVRSHVCISDSGGKRLLDRGRRGVLRGQLFGDLSCDCRAGRGYCGGALPARGLLRSTSSASGST